MSDSDNARRGKFYRGSAEKFLREYYNKKDRRKMQMAIKKDREPPIEQHRHGALWDAS